PKADCHGSFCGSVLARLWERRSARLTATNFPGPKQPEALAVPGDDGLRIDDHQGRSPIDPDLAQPPPINRSVDVSLGRFTERRSTPSWCRSARFSNSSVARDLRAVKTATTTT